MSINFNIILIYIPSLPDNINCLYIFNFQENNIFVLGSDGWRAQSLGTNFTLNQGQYISSQAEMPFICSLEVIEVWKPTPEMEFIHFASYKSE